MASRHSVPSIRGGKTYRLGLLILLFCASAQAQLVCTVDVQGANDPDGDGQSDVTQLCIDESGLPGSFEIEFSWDDNSFSGSNTGDACVLFDLDGDAAGNIDHALCTSVGGNPGSLVAGPTFYSCSGAVDRCGNPNLEGGGTGTVCSGAVQNSDPFSSGDDFPQDTVVNCTVDTGDIPAGWVRTNFCSFPSSQPNSNPKDCVGYVGGGFIEISKRAFPEDAISAATSFSFTISGTGTEEGDSVTVNETVNVNGNSITAISVPQGGPYTVAEAAQSGWTITDAVCDNGTVAGSTVSDVFVAASSTTRCEFTNLRSGSITIVKSANPADGTDFSFSGGLGDFTLDVDTTPALSDNISFTPPAPGTYTVTEQATPPFILDSIVCQGDDDSGSVVDLNLREVAIDFDASEGILCTFTNLSGADLSLSKVLDTAGPYAEGQTIQYTLVVSNGGPSAASNVAVSDTPSNLTISSVSSTPQGSCTALPCTLASLANGASETITVLATIDAAGAFDNTAAVTATEADPDPANNSDADGNGGTAGAAADLSLSKVLDTAGPYAEGQTIQYTLVVSNGGPSAASNVAVSDTPSNLTISSVSSTPQGSCTALPCTLASLANGASETITVLATIDAAGAFDNTAAVTATEADPDPANNSDADGNGGTAGAAADLSLSKVLDTAGPYAEGQTIQYTLVVSNGGPSAASNVAVSDTPSNLTISSVSSTPQGSCTALPCTLASLANGASETITVLATIDAAGAFDNTAAVTATEADPDPANNSDADGNGGTAGAAADLSLSKVLDTAGPYAEGQTIQYTLVVSNGGPSAASNVAVSDTPSNLTISSVSSTPQGSCTALPCTLASLANGASETITVLATIDAAGAFDNTAAVTATEADPDPANNSDADGNGGTAGAAADLSLSKVLDTAGPYAEGQTIQYTLVVSNGGPSAASNVAVSDTPSNLTISSVSSTPQGSCTALPCTLASLANGASETITVLATIDAAGAFDNTAAVTATEADPDPANNSDADGNGGTAGAAADLSLSKVLDTAGPYAEGQTIQYTLVVSNGGPSAASNVAVSDTPSNLTISSVSSTPQGSCTALPCTLASLANGASETITVLATIDAAGAFDNTAAVTATEADPDPANNSDADGNGGTAGAAADLSLSKVLDTAGPYAEGQTIQYTLVVSNGGPSAASNVAVSDTPSNLTISSVSSTPQGSCTALPCTLASLANGASETITVLATIDAAGAFDNTAAVTATEADPDPANNSDADGNGGTAGAPVLGVAKIAAAATDNGDGTFTTTVTITLENLGNVVLQNLQAVDDLAAAFPAPSTFSVSNLASAALTVNGSYDGSADTNLLAGTDSLAVGAITTLSFDVTFDPMGLPGPFLNSATAVAQSTGGATTSDISDDGTEPDANGNGNPGDSGENDPSPITYIGNPVIGAAKAATASIDNGDGTFSTTVTIVVENLGNVVLNNVQISDDLQISFPAPATFTAGLPNSSNLTVNPGFDGIGSTNLLSGTDTLAIGASASVSFVLTFAPNGASGPFSNIAIASASDAAGQPTSDRSTNGTDPDPNGDGDPSVPGDEDAPTQIGFTERAVLGIAKEAGPVADSFGDTFTLPLTMHLENLGNVVLTNVQVSDDLRAIFPVPAIIIVSDLASADLSVNPGFDGDTDIDLLLGTDSLNPGMTAEVSFNLTVGPIDLLGLQGPFNNLATARATTPTGAPVTDTSTDGNDPDPNHDGDPSEMKPTPLPIPEVSFGIPALNWLGLFLLMIMMGGIGVWRLRI